MTKLELVQAKAKAKNIKGEIKLSTRPDKKFMLSTIDGKRIHFGDITREDFLDHKDTKRRKAFHARFKSNKNYNVPYTSMFLARLLW